MTQRNGSEVRVTPGCGVVAMQLCEQGMVNLALMDRVLHVDEKTGRVTVQVGARVQQVSR